MPGSMYQPRPAGSPVGANFYFFPDPPREHGFPEIGIFTGLCYLAVVLLIVRWTHQGRPHSP